MLGLARVLCTILHCIFICSNSSIDNCAYRFLEDLGRNGEGSAEFLALYKRLIMPGHWRYYLAVKGVLMKIGSLINREIEELTALEETTLNSELSQGYALRSLTGMPSS